MDALGIQSVDDSCSQYVFISWLPPLNGTVESYYIECISSADIIKSNTEGATTNITLGALATGVQYDCSVSAVNEFGNGSAAYAEPFNTS